jgi:hypothetical protein
MLKPHTVEEEVRVLALASITVEQYIRHVAAVVDNTGRECKTGKGGDGGEEIKGGHYFGGAGAGGDGAWPICKSCLMDAPFPEIIKQAYKQAYKQADHGII